MHHVFHIWPDCISFSQNVITLTCCFFSCFLKTLKNDLDSLVRLTTSHHRVFPPMRWLTKSHRPSAAAPSHTVYHILQPTLAPPVSQLTPHTPTPTPLARSVWSNLLSLQPHKISIQRLWLLLSYDNIFCQISCLTGGTTVGSAMSQKW